MRSILIFITSILTANLLTADLIDDAKTKIKSGDFAEAGGYIATFLSNHPGDARAYTYKCFSDIGIFFEDTLPNYLLSNFNANNPETLESFDYDPTKQEIESKIENVPGASPVEQKKNNRNSDRKRNRRGVKELRLK